MSVNMEDLKIAFELLGRRFRCFIYHLSSI